jgi:uncharacterized membrane protein YfcA
MPLDPLLIAEMATLGLCTGFLAGLLGIGGGMIMVPFLTIILTKIGVAPELTIKMAIATSMATIVFTSISSVRAHHKRGAVRWDLVKRLAPGIVLGSLLGSMGFLPCSKGLRWPFSLPCLSAFPRPRCFWTRNPRPAGRFPEQSACSVPAR